MTLSLEVIVMLLKIWLFFMIVSTTSAVIEVLVFSSKYKILMILRYDLDWDKQGILTCSASIWFILLMYCSMIWRSIWAAILLVVMIIPVCSDQMKSVLVSSLIFFKALLTLVMWELESIMNFDLLSLLMRTIICFQKGFLVVMWSIGFVLSLLLITFWIFLILFIERLGKIFLIFKASLVRLAGVEA